MTEERDNLTERLQARDQLLYSVTEERDGLKANLTEKTREVDRLQSLSKQSECFSMTVLHRAGQYGLYQLS